ncbi:MAG: PxKF domain-containing protein [Roseiflexaceae bacterium]
MVHAADNAGNAASANVAYSVIYTFRGFFQPVDNLPVLNAVKAGSALPVKFSLVGNQGLTILAAGYPTSQPIPCDSAAPIDDIEQMVTAAGSSLAYDATNDQYVYVWKTDTAWAGGCRQLIVRLADGTDHRADFAFK